MGNAAITRATGTAYRYAKARIMLTELVPLTRVSLLAVIDREERRRLNAALDEVNARFGRNILVPAAMGLQRSWSTRFERKSPSYTILWADLPSVVSTL
ncbi:DUF4113 domain-containing protein [Mesorhizobium sp. PL10]